MGKGTRATAGHLPLTHHERTKKFTIHSGSTDNNSADYGTTSLRLAGYTQYQVDTCALTTQSLAPSSSSSSDSNDTSIALCSPSGYLYDETSILEYLLLQTQQIKDRQRRQQEQQEIEQQQQQQQIEYQNNKRQLDLFHNTQNVIGKKTKGISESQKEVNDLHHVSYWLSSAQPVIPDKKQQVVSNNRSMTTTTTGTILALTDGNNNTNNTNNNNKSTSNSTDIVVTSSTTSIPNNVLVFNNDNEDDDDNNNDVPTTTTTTIPDRPVSPMTGRPISRKDLWPVQLLWTTTTTSNTTSTSTNSTRKVKCCVSDRIISSTGAPSIAYWTTKKPYNISSNNDSNYGKVLLQSVYEKELSCKNEDDTHVNNNNNNNTNQSKRDTTSTTTTSIRLCPITDRTIRHVRILQRSGSSYAGSGQKVMSAQQYRPTIT